MLALEGPPTTSMRAHSCPGIVTYYSPRVPAALARANQVSYNFRSILLVAVSGQEKEKIKHS